MTGITYEQIAKRLDELEAKIAVDEPECEHYFSYDGENISLCLGCGK